MAKASKVEVMHDLPDDVINMILVTLPATSLLRFRYVCKQWNETITSRTFAAQHIKRASSLSLCTFVHWYNSPSDNNFTRATRISTSHQRSLTAMYTIRHPGDFAASHHRRVSSCNGLLCVAGTQISEGRLRTSIQVCNPATGSCTEIERLPVEIDQIPPVKRIILGFGYDPNVDDYKIVYLFREDTEDISKKIVLVLSLKSNVWRSIDTSTSPDLSCVVYSVTYSSSPISCSGCVYCVVFTNRKDRRRVMILKFNLTDERFELLPLPDETTTLCRRQSTLASHKGSLYVLLPQNKWKTNKKSNESSYEGTKDAWMLECMDGNKAKWLKKRVIPTFKGNVLHPLGFNCNGHVIMVYDLPNQGLLYAYLPKQNEFVELGTVKKFSGFHFVQTETLALSW